jgi:hypothetical protein
MKKDDIEIHTHSNKIPSDDYLNWQEASDESEGNEYKTASWIMYIFWIKTRTR